MTPVLAVGSAQAYPRTLPLAAGEADALRRLILASNDSNAPLNWGAVVREALNHRIRHFVITDSQLTVSTEMAWLVLAHACEQAITRGPVRDSLLSKLDPKGRKIADVVLEARSAGRTLETEHAESPAARAGGEAPAGNGPTPAGG